MVSIEVSGKSLKLNAAVDILDIVRFAFSMEKPHTNTTNMFSASRDFVITPSGSFHVGLLDEIEQFLIDNRIAYTVADEARNLFSQPIPILNVESINGIVYRDYQITTIEKFLQRGRGIGELPTSAGKTAVMAGFFKTYLTHNKGKILVAVPNTLLLYQAANDFKDFGLLDFSLFSGETADSTDWNASIIISTYSMLTQKKKTKEPEASKRPYKWLNKFKNFDIIMVDEVHQLANKDNSILKFVANCKTTHKYGLTGTVPDNDILRWTVIGRIGPVLYKKTSYELRQSGHITDVRVKILEFQHDDYIAPQVTKDDPPTTAYIHEKEYLATNIKRNTRVVKICRKANNNILILVDRIEHGNIIYNALVRNCPDKQVFYARGATPSEERENIKNIMEANDNVICVAIVKLFSTGVSIKNLPWVIMMGIGKSKIQLLQTIGRSLRLHVNKTIATIFDIADNTYYSQLHLNQRIEYYEREKINYTHKKI